MNINQFLFQKDCSIKIRTSSGPSSHLLFLRSSSAWPLIFNSPAPLDEPETEGRSTSILSSPRRVGRGERDRDRDGEGLSRLFDSFPFLKGGRSWVGLLLRDLEYEGLPRRRRGLMLRFLPAGVPLRRLAYLRGGDLEGLRDSDFIRRRLAGGGLRLPLSLNRRSL